MLVGATDTAMRDFLAVMVMKHLALAIIEEANRSGGAELIAMTETMTRLAQKSEGLAAVRDDTMMMVQYAHAIDAARSRREEAMT